MNHSRLPSQGLIWISKKISNALWCANMITFGRRVFCHCRKLATFSIPVLTWFWLFIAISWRCHQDFRRNGHSILVLREYDHCFFFSRWCVRLRGTILMFYNIVAIQKLLTMHFWRLFLGWSGIRFIFKPLTERIYLLILLLLYPRMLLMHALRLRSIHDEIILLLLELRCSPMVRIELLLIYQRISFYLQWAVMLGLCLIIWHWSCFHQIFNILTELLILFSNCKLWVISVSLLFLVIIEALNASHASITIRLQHIDLFQFRLIRLESYFFSVLVSFLACNEIFTLSTIWNM